LYVRYRRQSYQNGAESPVRITLDSRIIMAAASDWSPSAGQTYRYQQSILEAKLEAAKPAWLDSLLEALPLTPLGNFSKWVHGVSRVLDLD